MLRPASWLSAQRTFDAPPQWPQLAARVLDIAPVCSIAAQYVAAERLSERIHTLPSDMFDDPLAGGKMPISDG